MQEIAESRGGKCLSSNYLNAHAKLLWECSEGHQWEAIPSNIKKKVYGVQNVVELRQRKN